MPHRRGDGYTLVEIMVVASLLALLMLIAVPAVMKARVNAQQKLCIHNLRLIDDAMSQVMIQSNFLSTASITTTMLDAYLKCGSIAALDWPEGIQPPDDSVLQASEQFGLYVDFRGTRVKLER